MIKNGIHSSPSPGPKIETSQWTTMCDSVAKIAQAGIKAEKWSDRLPYFVAISAILSTSAAFVVRVGLGDELRLVSVGYKLSSLSIVILGVGVNRTLAAIEGKRSASQRLKKKVKSCLDAKHGVPDHQNDRSKIQSLYEQCVRECPWILRYMVTPSDLSIQLELGCGDVVRLRSDKRFYRRSARLAVKATGLCVAATLCSLCLKKGVVYALSYGFNAAICGLAATARFHCRYQRLRQEVRWGEELANQAVAHRLEVLDQYPEVLTRVNLLDLDHLDAFKELREARVSELPDTQSVPLHLGKLTLTGGRTSLASLPVRIHTFSAGVYAPRTAECLSSHSRLKKVSFVRVEGSALDNLATLPALWHLRIDQLDTLDHRVFRHLSKLSTNTLPPSAAHRVGFENLVLTRPTTGCLYAIQNMRTIHSLVLKKDPGIDKACLDALFSRGEVSYLKVKNWKNDGQLQLSEFRAFWQFHQITLGDTRLKYDELLNAVQPQKPATLIISVL